MTRAQCAKGCEGPLLATSRRLSSLGKRLQEGTAAAPAAAAKPGLAGVKASALGVQLVDVRGATCQLASTASLPDI